MSNRVLRFINNTSHKEPLDTNQKGDILRTGEDEYSIRIDKEYHVLTDNVKTIETDDYLNAEKTDNTVHLSIDEQPLIELIKNNCCDETDLDTVKYEKQIITDIGVAKFITDGNVFMYQQMLNQEQVDAIGLENVVIELNEINNVRDKHENGFAQHTATAYVTGSHDTYRINLNIVLDDNGLSLSIPYTNFTGIELSPIDSLIIDYTGILDFEVDDDDDNGDGPIG